MTPSEQEAIAAYAAAVDQAAEEMQRTLMKLSELHAALPMKGRFAWRPPAEVLRHLIDRGPR